MPKPIDIADKRFGRLIALRPYSHGKKKRWKCICDCGNTTNVVTNKLTSGRTKSCGCIRLDGSIRRTHGMKGTRVYNVWKGINKRCVNKNTKCYNHYGGRGISVCERWKRFENFYEDMGEPPTNKHSIDRIDNNGNYDPENCRWATTKEQARNRRNNIIIEYNGESLCISEWAERYKLKAGTLWKRIKLGMKPPYCFYAI